MYMWPVALVYIESTRRDTLWRKMHFSPSFRTSCVFFSPVFLRDLTFFAFQMNFFPFFLVAVNCSKCISFSKEKSLVKHFKGRPTTFTYFAWHAYSTFRLRKDRMLVKSHSKFRLKKKKRKLVQKKVPQNLT